MPNQEDNKKKDVKVQDLSPKKDAKGGVSMNRSTNAAGLDSRSADGAGLNSSTKNADGSVSADRSSLG